MFRHDPGLTTIRAPRRSNRPATGDADADRTRNLSHGFEQALRLPERPRSRWHRGGVSRRTERVLNGIFATVLLTFAVGWTWSIAEARASGGPLDDETTPATAAIGAALTDPDAPTIAYLTDATVELFAPLRGESGRLRAVVGKSGEPIAADSLPTGASIITYPTAGDARASARIDSLRGDTARTVQSLGATLESLAVDSARVPLAPEESGVWSTAIRVGNVLKQVTDFSVITLTPISERRRGRIGLYYIGTWPTERGRRRPGYLTPSGFIEVTPESQDTPV